MSWWKTLGGNFLIVAHLAESYHQGARDLAARLCFGQLDDECPYGVAGEFLWKIGAWRGLCYEQLQDNGELDPKQWCDGCAQAKGLVKSEHPYRGIPTEDRLPSGYIKSRIHEADTHVEVDTSSMDLTVLHLPDLPAPLEYLLYVVQPHSPRYYPLCERHPMRLLYLRGFLELLTCGKCGAQWSHKALLLFDI